MLPQLATALKLTPGLFLLALPLMGRFRAASSMAATVLLAVFVLPWPFCGHDEHRRHLADFFHHTLGAVVTPQTAAITQDYSGPSVRGAIDYLLQPKPIDDAGHTANLFDFGTTTTKVVRIAWTEVAVLLDQECRLATGWYVGATIVVSGAPFPHVAELPVRTRAPRVASPGLRAPAVLHAAISPLRMRSEIA